MRASSPDAFRRSFDAARECLAEERRRTTAELRALESFADEVRALLTGSISVDAGRATVTRPTRAPRETGGTDAVRAAYESTLIGLSHYDDEFGDTYVESVAEEFGPDAAAPLVERDVLDDRPKCGCCRPRRWPRRPARCCWTRSTPRASPSTPPSGARVRSSRSYGDSRPRRYRS